MSLQEMIDRQTKAHRQDLFDAWVIGSLLVAAVLAHYLL